MARVLGGVSIASRPSSAPSLPALPSIPPGRTAAALDWLDWTRRCHRKVVCYCGECKRHLLVPTVK